MSKKFEGALAVKDKSLAFLREHGVWQEAYIGGRIYVPTLGKVNLSHRMPFSAFEEMSSQNNCHSAATNRFRSPYGLDVWAGKKVMNLEWDEEGNVEIVSFRRGEWENSFD